MPDIFVPPAVAESFIAYMNAQRGTLPPAFSELSSRLSAALATPTLGPVGHNFSQPLPSWQTRSGSSATSASSTRPYVPPPQRLGALRRMHSLPPEDTRRLEPDFLAAVQRRVLPALPIQRTPASSDRLPSPQSSPLLPPVSSPNVPRSPLGSSPTLKGDNTLPFHTRFLSPLRLDSETPVQSPSSSALGKRAAAHLDSDSDEDENEEEDTQCGRQSLTGLKIRLPARAAVQAVGRTARDDGDCPRRGKASRTGSNRDIGNMPCNQPDCGTCVSGKKNNKQSGQRKRRRKEKVPWRLDPDGGPAITEDAGRLLSKLLAVFGRAHRQDLEEVLAGLQGGLTMTDSHDMASVVARIKQQTNEIRVREVHLMLSLIQLALNVDSLRADAKLKHLRRVTGKDLAQKYAPGTHENTFAEWVNHGKKLLLLCAGGPRHGSHPHTKSTKDVFSQSTGGVHGQAAAPASLPDNEIDELEDGFTNSSTPVIFFGG
ncbi:hypothetical protein GGX14DRAFT_565248 [Mycena pura]|uniref:Uncharacterized protein n=1 Tax=Mycena pura TaxID=153505 RepID=A0AAD6YG08_9AGAR|nr:hypothetical protein GGX14DRAFT_565248 [Mycena pura]